MLSEKRFLNKAARPIPDELSANLTLPDYGRVARHSGPTAKLAKADLAPWLAIIFG